MAAAFPKDMHSIFVQLCNWLKVYTLSNSKETFNILRKVRENVYTQTHTRVYICKSLHISGLKVVHLYCNVQGPSYNYYFVVWHWGSYWGMIFRRLLTNELRHTSGGLQYWPHLQFILSGFLVFYVLFHALSLLHTIVLYSYSIASPGPCWNSGKFQYFQFVESPFLPFHMEQWSQ